MDYTATDNTLCATSLDNLSKESEASKLASLNILNEDNHEDLKNESSSNYFCFCCMDEYKDYMCERMYAELNALEMGEGPSTSSSSGGQRPGIEKLQKRINGMNGLLVRGVDLRHLPQYISQIDYFTGKFQPSNYINYRGQWKRDPKALDLGVDEREQLVKKDPFGMDSFNLGYSLGKKKRWELYQCFEESPEKFQHPLDNITTVLMSSTQIPESSQLYAEQFPPLIEGVQSSYRVKRLIAAEPNGKLYTKESKTGRALPQDILKPVKPLEQPTRQQPKHKKAARRFRRREMLRKRVECQENPIRLTYFLTEPRPTTKQLQSESMIKKFTSVLHGKKCPKSHKHRSSLIDPEDYSTTYDSDYDSQGEIENVEDYYLNDQKARGFSLADYVVDETNEDCSSFELYSPESFEFVARNKRKSSTGSSITSYELVDELAAE